MSENASENFDMTDVTHAQTAEEMRRHVIRIGSQEPGETTERMLWRAARRLGEGYQRVRSYYHRDARKIEAHQLLNARQRAEEMNRLRAQIAALEVQQRHDLDAMAAQLPTLLGPLYPLAVKAGLVNPEAVGAEEDGEG